MRFDSTRGSVCPKRLVARRVDSGFFWGDDIEDPRLIRSAKEFGFSLNEIRELLTLWHELPEPCRQTEQLLATKLNTVKEKVAVFETLEVKLSEALDECRQTCRSSRSREQAPCLVLEEITHGESAR